MLQHQRDHAPVPPLLRNLVQTVLRDIEGVIDAGLDILIGGGGGGSQNTTLGADMSHSSNLILLGLGIG